MSTTDPIADFLTRVRNSSQAGLSYTIIPASRLKIEMTKLLEAEGFIRGFRLIRDGKQGKIKIALKYTENGESVIRGLKRVSRPGLRVYSRSSELPKVRGGLGVAVISTPKGVCVDRDARAQGVGGEVLAHVW